MSGMSEDEKERQRRQRMRSLAIALALGRARCSVLRGDDRPPRRQRHEPADLRTMANPMTATDATAQTADAASATAPSPPPAVSWSLAMVGLSFAAVPLYRLFCQVTGYRRHHAARRQGVRRRARPQSSRCTSTPTSPPSLPWTFEPVQPTLDVKVGENTLAFYRATNISDKPTTGTATFNVSPDVVGALLQQDAVLLLHRADAGAGAVDRDAGDRSSSIRPSSPTRRRGTCRS